MTLGAKNFPPLPPFDPLSPSPLAALGAGSLPVGEGLLRYPLTCGGNRLSRCFDHQLPAPGSRRLATGSRQSVGTAHPTDNAHWHDACLFDSFSNSTCYCVGSGMGTATPLHRVGTAGSVLVLLFCSFPRSSVGMQVWPLQRPKFHDAGASGLAPTLERGSQRESRRLVTGNRQSVGTAHPTDNVRWHDACLFDSFSNSACYCVGSGMDTATSLHRVGTAKPDREGGEASVCGADALTGLDS